MESNLRKFQGSFNPIQSTHVKLTPSANFPVRFVERTPGILTLCLTVLNPKHQQGKLLCISREMAISLGVCHELSEKKIYQYQREI